MIFLSCFSHHPPPGESHRGLYVALAYTSANEVAVTKLNRTLATMATELSAATNTLISPLLIPLPSSFTGFNDVHSTLLNKTVITTVVLAPDSPGLLPALSSLQRQVPLFWATGQVLHGYLERESLGVFEIRLEAGLHDVFQALRSLLVVTHWHSFTLIHTTLPFTSSLLNVISKPPLSPQIVPLRPNASPYAIFRMLSEISRATKGVVLLMSDGKVTKKVMDEAKRLHMVDGDFVWLWIDTSAAVKANLNSSKQHIDNDAVEMITESREKRAKPGPFRSFESNNTFVRNKRRRFVFFHDDFVNKHHPLPSSSPSFPSYSPHSNYSLPPLPVGLLAVKALPMKIDKHFVRATMRMVFDSMRKTYLRYCSSNHPSSESCFKSPSVFSETNFTQLLFREMRHVTHEALSGRKNESSLVTRFQILNLVPTSPLQNSNISESISWRPVGEIIGHSDVRLETIVWPGGELVPASTTKGARSIFRVVTALAPPFVMEGELDEDGQCLRGLECHRLLTSGKDNLTLVFNEMEKFEDDEEEVDKLTRAREIWSFGRSNVFHHSRSKTMYIYIQGVFLLLGFGVVAGCMILCMEHLFYKYTLPILRHKPKGTIWRSRNVMFFSQKLYRFINCVELVSPHHAARELVHTLRQGQITSLFQKNVKADQDTSRRRKSKSQFFEMIQEIRRAQQAEKQDSKDANSPSKNKKNQNRAKSPQVLLSPPELIKQQRRLSPSKLEFARRLSKDFFRSKSSGNLNTSRRMSIDVNLATGRFLDFQSAQTIGRRLSHGVANSPPDVNSRRSSALTPRRESSPEPIQECEREPTTPTPNLLLPRGPSSTSLTPKYDTSPRSPSSRNFPAIPSRDIGSAAKKFSYVDVNSSSFKNKISKIQKHDSSSSKDMHTLAVSPNNRPQDSTISINEDCNLNRENWANVSGKSVEHIIEIILPDDKGSKSEVKKSNKKSDRANNVPKASKDKQKKTKVSDEGDAKPKIVSYIPRKPESENSNGSNNSEQDLPKPESPLQKLSREELLHLVETPEQELKNSILEALKYKDPT
ncbi:hypothetical protein WDU94_004803 [Cyamophila willieti]